MRILHVSDLHFGRALGDVSREPEQRAFVAEIGAIARERDVALTVIAGDVFDAFTPPAWAEDLFFELLDVLADGGRRGVAVIAGNHDSGVRLAAAEPLARRLGIVLLGDPNEALRGFEGDPASVRVTALAPQVARFDVPGADAPIVVGMLPFFAESRVVRGEGEASDRDADASRYALRLQAELDARALVKVDGAAHVLIAHQYVTGGDPSESERRLRALGIGDLDASRIPAGVDYVALGHLHKPQTIAGSASLAIYAGSPIAYSFSEAGQAKRAVLVTIEGGKTTTEDVPLTSGRPLEVWACDSLEDAEARAKEGTKRRPIVEIVARFGRRMSAQEGEALIGLSSANDGVTIIGVRDAFQAAVLAREAPRDDAPALRVEDLFRELYQRKFHEAPDDAVMEELGAALVEVTKDPAGEAVH
jgi:exonuclease SbcD